MIIPIKLIAKRSIQQSLSVSMLLLAMFFLHNDVSAQTRGRVQIIKDSRIDSLIANRSEEAKSLSGNANSVLTRGYRVQFFISSNRNDVYAKQAEFNQMYPDLRTYITYQEPNYKIKAGDFRTRLEAQKLMHDLRPMFPTLFLISEKINPPKLDTNDD